jgi:DNA-binding transcriptional LysR family regulator
MDTMLDLNDIVVFARVIEAGSFTAAARLLGMPKTTVSRRIAALEREVGVRLLQRTTRSLNVTDAGRLYYEESSQALRTIEDANLRLAEARAEPSGTIRISAPVGFGGYFLSSAIFDFLATYPKTKVELRLTDDKLNLVENGIDLSFRTGILPDSTLIARKLGSTHRILCASPNYLARHGAPVVPADLARHHCVIAGPSTANAHWVLEGSHGQETVTVSGRFAANEMQAVIAAAIAGYGIAQLPHRVAEASIKIPWGGR